MPVVQNQTGPSLEAQCTQISPQIQSIPVRPNRPEKYLKQRFWKGEGVVLLSRSAKSETLHSEKGRRLIHYYGLTNWIPNSLSITDWFLLHRDNIHSISPSFALTQYTHNHLHRYRLHTRMKSTPSFASKSLEFKILVEIWDERKVLKDRKLGFKRDFERVSTGLVCFLLSGALRDQFGLKSLLFTAVEYSVDHFEP